MIQHTLDFINPVTEKRDPEELLFLSSGTPMDLRTKVNRSLGVTSWRATCPHRNNPVDSVNEETGDEIQT